MESAPPLVRTHSLDRQKVEFPAFFTTAGRLLEEKAPVESRADSDLVLFTLDRPAQVFRGGMFSGNTLAD